MTDQAYAVKLATAPTVEPLTYADIRDYMRLSNDTEETLVTELIKEARQRVERESGLKLITQAWDLYLDTFPAYDIIIPIEPLISVTSIKTTTAAGVESTLAASNYQVDVASSPPRIALSDTGSWPGDLRRTQAIAIRVSAGYGATGASVPGPLLQALRVCVAAWYVERGGRENQIIAPSWLGYSSNINLYKLPGLA